MGVRSLVEAAGEIKTNRNYMKMEKCDMPATWVASIFPRALTSYAPQTRTRKNVVAFVDRYCGFCGA